MAFWFPFWVGLLVESFCFCYDTSKALAGLRSVIHHLYPSSNTSYCKIHCSFCCCASLWIGCVPECTSEGYSCSFCAAYTRMSQSMSLTLHISNGLCVRPNFLIHAVEDSFLSRLHPWGWFTPLPWLVVGTSQSTPSAVNFPGV